MDRRQAYGRYQKARNASWDCLIDCRIRQLPVSAFNIAGALHIKVGAYSWNAGMLRQKGYAPLLRASGFAYADPQGNMVIFYDDQAGEQQLRFTLAHELGHILLGHLGQKGQSPPRGQLILPSDPKLEKEADRFALRLLAPACALWAMGAYSAEDIVALCDIPIDRAEARARRMADLRERGKWLTSPKERQLFRQLGLSPPDGASLDGA